MAVKSSYTFLVANPGHQETIENLNFYMQDKDFHERMLVDLLRSDYEVSVLQFEKSKFEEPFSYVTRVVNDLFSRRVRDNWYWGNGVCQ